MVTAKPAEPTLGSVEELNRCCSRARVINKSRAPLAPRCAVWPTEYQYKARDDRTENLLLTVWEAAERT